MRDFRPCRHCSTPTPNTPAVGACSPICRAPQPHITSGSVTANTLRQRARLQNRWPRRALIPQSQWLGSRQGELQCGWIGSPTRPAKRCRRRRTTRLTRGNPELLPEHFVLALLEQDGGVAKPVFEKAGVDARALAAELRRKSRRACRASRAAPSRRCRAACATCSRTRGRRPKSSRTSTRRPSTCCSRCSTSKDELAKLLEQRGLDRKPSCWRRCSKCAAASA